jgi:large-conductance mechanosensitive channel
MCRKTPEPVGNEWPWDSSIERVCSTTTYGYYQCPGDTVCGNPDEYEGMIDLSTEKLGQKSYIQYGIVNFDHVGTSLLTVFQMITSETWQFQMYNIMDADVPLLGFIYGTLVIIVGQFFLLNLILAVIIEAFIGIQKKELKAKMERFQSQHSRKQPELSKKALKSDSSLETESSSNSSKEEDTMFFNANQENGLGRKKSTVGKKKRGVKKQRKSVRKSENNSEGSSREIARVGAHENDDEDLFL